MTEDEMAGWHHGFDGRESSFFTIQLSHLYMTTGKP